MKQFKTESEKLLNLMINSIYTNREIFLRELISNASDAMDKLQLLSDEERTEPVNPADLQIFIALDGDARTITVSDHGIGMTKEELDRNLGTIAHSDSMELKGGLAGDESRQLDLIGQFGVGFYSSFMVADEVHVISRAYGSDEAWEWICKGLEGYSIRRATRDTFGTDVILTIKPDLTDNPYMTDEEAAQIAAGLKRAEVLNYNFFLSQNGIKYLVQRYSNYVRYPIRMEVTKHSEIPAPNDSEAPQVEYWTEIETLNSMVPIWKKGDGEVTFEEYAEYYKSDFHDFEDPAFVLPLHVGGAVAFDGIIFIPKHLPPDIFTKNYEKGLALYSSNVLIREHCAELVPDHFSFIRGVVDTADISLNLSRETVQENGLLSAIGRRVETEILESLYQLQRENRPVYEALIREVGRIIKQGIMNAYGQNARVLGPLLMFESARQQRMVTLEEYMLAAPASQTLIFFATGDNVELMRKMPIVTSILSRGYDVLLCTEEIDDFCLTTVKTYGIDKLGAGENNLLTMTFRNVAGGDLRLAGEEERQRVLRLTEENVELFDTMVRSLGGKVRKVLLSTRLVDDPVCITAEGAISLTMEKTLASFYGDEYKSRRVLEINPNHRIFEVLVAAQNAGDYDKVGAYTYILYNQALLVAGLPVDDPVAFCDAFDALMV